MASRCGTAVPFHTYLSSDLFLGIAKWLNAFYTHTNMCTHTYTPAQCCDLDSFWFLSADDWQVLNESSLERLPSRPVHQLSTYNTRTHTPIFILAHTHPQTHLLSLSARILHPTSEPQSVRPLLKERLTVSGRHGRFSSIILSLWSGLIQHRRNVSCTIVRYGSIQTRYGSKQYGLVEVQVHERVCLCCEGLGDEMA